MTRGELNYNPFGRISKQLRDKHQNNEQIKVKSMPGDGWWHFSMNLRNPGMGPRVEGRPVRQAAVHSVPKTAINDQLLYGYTKPGWNLIGEAFGRYSNPDVKRYEEGVENGKSLLEEEGYKWDDDGMLHFPAE
jgi:peptide/nickel transport system substrate-binding protein